MIGRLLACAFVAALSGAATAQGPAIPRTPDGHPDFQGVWESSWRTTLERPKEAEGPIVSAEKAPALVAAMDAALRGNGNLSPDSDFDYGPLLPAAGDGYRTSLITEPADGKQPLTQAAQDTAKWFKETRDLAEGPEARGLTERCMRGPGATPLTITPDAMHRRIVQTTTATVIATENMNDLRIIDMSGRARTPVGLSWVGTSQGRWEGDVLVVETSNLRPDPSSPPAPPNLPPRRIVERFQLTSPDRLQYGYAIEDPAMYTGPLHADFILVRSTEGMFESACHEGNYSLAGILSGARAMERRPPKPEPTGRQVENERQMKRPLAVIGLWLAIVSSANPQTPALPRTPDGHPDFSGVWDSSWITPLERPPEAKSLVMTPAEAKTVEAAILARRRNPSELDPELAYPDVTGFAIVRGERRSSMLVDPADGHIPFLDEPAARKLATPMLRATDGPEPRPLNERCLAGMGRSPILLAPAGNLREVIETHDDVVIRTEHYSDVRILPLNGETWPSIPGGWNGMSTTRWEGDVLVIRTTGFRTDDPLRSAPGSAFPILPKTIITERLSLSGPDEITYAFTVDDASLYARAWTAETVWRRSRDHVMEFACHEGNYGLAGILSGARAMERRPPKPEPTGDKSKASGK